MGCGSSTPTFATPKTKSSNQNDVIVTSDVTEQDFASSTTKSKKASSQTNGTAQPIKPKSNGTTQHQVQQQNTTTQHQVQQQNGSAKSRVGLTLYYQLNLHHRAGLEKTTLLLKTSRKLQGIMSNQSHPGKRKRKSCLILICLRT